jgi:hypothetical protein
MSLAAARGGPVQWRVAASVGHLGLVARLLCPVLGAAVLGWALDIGSVRWQSVRGGILPLAFPPTAISTAPQCASVTSDLAQFESVRACLRLLVDRTAALSVSRKVLWGNVISAINGASASIVAARPDLSQRAGLLATVLLRDLAPARSYTGQLGADFRRRSCCLYYRAIAAGCGTLCDDCILRAPPPPPARIN